MEARSLYKGQQMAQHYAAHRPGYPPEMFDIIMSYHKQVKTSGHELAVDVCCGTGQSTIPLTKLFRQVVGVDISEDQLQNLPKDVPNLTSFVGLAEDLNMIESGTVDLVTIATGLHWVNIDKFLQEARRVLKPGGTFAAYTWTMDQMDDPKANEYYREIFKLFKDYHSPRGIVGLEKYQSIIFPFSRIQRYDVSMRVELTLDQFIEEIRARMTSILSADGKDDDNVTLKMTKYFFLVLGNKELCGANDINK
nr:putative S-adenosylmethionine-dependent methyltransferase CRG1 [Biomphalaria glabrata]